MTINYQPLWTSDDGRVLIGRADGCTECLPQRELLRHTYARQASAAITVDHRTVDTHAASVQTDAQGETVVLHPHICGQHTILATYIAATQTWVVADPTQAPSP